MISIKSNPKSGKLPVPGPNHPELSASNVVDLHVPDLPESLDRKKHPELSAPKRSLAALAKGDVDPGAPKTTGKLSALAAQIKDPERRAAVEKIEREKAEVRRIKRSVKAEKKQAAATGATRAMPLQGKEAKAALKTAAKKNAAQAKRELAAEAALEARAERSGKTKQTKSALIAGLLKRKEGCTTADVLKATGWPSVSMPRQAKEAGIRLRKVKEKGQVTRYYAA